MTLAWPAEAPAGDPFPEPVPADVRPEDAVLLGRLAEAWAGGATIGLEDAARACGVDHPLEPELRQSERAPLPSLETLARIAADHDPAVGAAGPDLVLGPWADEADRHALLTAVAHAAFFPGDGVSLAPVVWWRRQSPPPTRVDRRSVAAVERAPLAPWRIASVGADAVVLADLVGLGTAAPDGPVHLGSVALRDRLPRADDHLLARVVHGPDGFVAMGPIALPAWPPTEVVGRWWRWLTWEARLVAPGRCRTGCDVLRLRGHAFSRRLLAWAWA